MTARHASAGSFSCAASDVTNKCDIGIAYDGDEDRCLAVNDKVEIIDNIILSLIGAMKEKGELKNNTGICNCYK